MAVRATSKEQLQRNTVVLISLVVAVTSLGYNTWRSHYDTDETDKGNARTGWAIVLTITDLAIVLEEPLPAAAEDLRVVWDACRPEKSLVAQVQPDNNRVVI